jgi:transcriptional regulator GlxA family with amidase domain
VNKKHTFLDIFSIFPDNMSMEGLTISEMAEILGVARRTVEMRLFRAGIKSISQEAVYDKSALEAIRDVPGKGRPRKPKE